MQRKLYYIVWEAKHNFLLINLLKIELDQGCQTTEEV